MGEIVTRKRGAKWEYRFEIAPISGKRKYTSKSGFKTKAEALAAGTKAQNDYLQAGVTFTASQISYNDYLDFWMDNYCKVNLKKTTVTGYKKKIRLYIKPVLGGYHLKSITPETLQKFINGLFNDGFSRNTLTDIKGILTNSFSYAVIPLHYIQTNPTAYLKLPSPRATAKTQTRSSPHFFINQNDMDRIFDRFPKTSTAYLPLVLGYKCGLRLGEAFALTWDCINFAERTLKICKQVQWHEKDKDDVNDNSYWYFSQPKYGSSRTITIDINVKI